MKKGKKLAEELFSAVIGQAPRIKLGYGSFLKLDFGKDIAEELLTRKGKEIIYLGEWRLWVYMCAWRIDLLEEPFVGSDDDREIIQQKLSALNNKKILEFSVLNSAFDALLKFESGYELKLFSFETTENEQWKFYTREQKVFVAGPRNTWYYESSDKARK